MREIYHNIIILVREVLGNQKTKDKVFAEEDNFVSIWGASKVQEPFRLKRIDHYCSLLNLKAIVV